MPRGGTRKGAGRPPRDDGRKGKLYQMMTSPEEDRIILDNSTPDERRIACLTYIAQTKGIYSKIE